MERNYFYACYGSDVIAVPEYCDFNHMLAVLEHQKEPECGLELNIYTDIVRVGHDRKILDYKDVLKKYRVSFHAPHWETDASAELDSPKGEANIKAYEEALALADEIGVKSMVMHTHQRRVDAKQKNEMRENVVRTIRVFSDMCRVHGVELLVENVGFYITNSMLFDQNEYVELFNYLPEDVGSLIDIGHAILNGWNIDKLIRDLAPKIKSYHIHNNGGDQDSHMNLFADGMKYSPAQVEALFLTMEELTPAANLIFEYGPKAHVTPESMHKDFARVDAIRSSFYMKDRK